jgi:UDP-glucose 4-epimerase
LPPTRPKTILVTGGLGYIGSHTCIALAEAGYRLIVVDNLCNAKESVLPRLRALAGADIEFHRIDLRERDPLEKVFSEKAIDSVVHFAGLKSVGESMEKPALYRENNVGGTVVLLQAMARHRVPRIVFSSSATVYGNPERLPMDEQHPLRPLNPYGETKLAVERLLVATSVSNTRFQYAALRYFNPIGAHASGRIGEDPRGVPNNLLPYVSQVAVGRLAALRVFGNDYPTSDGTGVRDYIHVADLAQGHIAALRFLEGKPQSIVANLGTGRGYSVLETVKAFERASGRKVPLEIVARRPGDVAACVADPALAAAKMGWKAMRGIDEMCADAWRWQSQNPDGYPDL